MLFNEIVFVSWLYCCVVHTHTHTFVSLSGYRMIRFDFYLVTGIQIEGERVPEEEARHAVQYETVQGQIQRGDPRLLLLKNQHRYPVRL